MPERLTAHEQLERILYILAVAARQDGVTLAELANALGTDETAVLRDIQEVMTRSYYHPAGYVESISVSVEGDRVHVWSAEEVRPVRLSPAETLALGLGLRLIAAEADDERRAAILELTARLEATLAVPDAEAMETWHAVHARAPMADDDGSIAPYSQDSHLGAVDDDVKEAGPGYALELAGYAIAAGEDEIRALLAGAARDRVRCWMRYAKPGDEAPTERSIAPYLLVYAEGRWYVLAHDDSHDAVRVFRIDRILRVERTSESFEVPTDFDPSAFIRDGRVYHGDADVRVRVRYSPRIASWLLERQLSNAESSPDGSVVVPHDVADPRWLVRHVLQYGPDAEVLDPPELRQAVADALVHIV